MIRLEGISSQNIHLVHVTGGNMRRVTLLAIPSHAAAERASAAAARQKQRDQPGDAPR
ncbi:hypothetical protein C791_0922 [Amycolatopsis azurea DSM 43854]|uniref:Uncharacterized protein n=1 Tax=Amycolatopsis azurea DSM 43854 TaxID=1238180 RepID=M2Q6M4_9PSEU|nr:hypothetical protein C791_0922 [Amycolatopsis azurea DSM 43854]